MPEYLPIKILFLSAQPNDQQRLSSEFDDISNKLEKSIATNDLRFLPPTWETDYESLLIRLHDDRPNVIHYSGHSNQEGLCLKNKISGKTQLIENNELNDIFENRGAYLKLVILSSCFSTVQAQIISNQNLYVLGLNEEIENNFAKELANYFYLGFIVQDNPVQIEKAITIGCTNFTKTFPEKTNLISLWKNGEEVDFKTLVSKKVVIPDSISIENKKEEFRNSLLNFNYSNQIQQITETLAPEKTNLFVFDGNCPNEAKFIYKILEQRLNTLNDKFGFPRFEVISVSNNIDKESLIDSILVHTGYLNRKTVALCLKFSKRNKILINEVINDLTNTPPPTGKYPFLIFLLPESFIKNNLCTIIPHSASIVNPAKGEHLCFNHIKKYINYSESELKKWVDENQLKIETLSNCSNKITNFCKTYFEDVDEDSFLNWNEKFMFNFLNEFTKTNLGYEITFENDLKLKLKEWQNL